MGTSTARRGPVGRGWRAAKITATRYLSPEAPGAVRAQEVAARYVAALTETATKGGGDIMGAFALTRKAAQNLGAFLARAGQQGWPKALKDRHLAHLAPEPPETAAAPLAGALVGEAGGLEASVAAPALASCLLEYWLEGKSSPPTFSAVASEKPIKSPEQIVRQFLARVLEYRLAFDLGESLEAGASGWRSFDQGLTQIRAVMDQALAGASPGPAAPREESHWEGLPGWLWVTRELEALLQRLKGSHAP